MRHRKKQVKLGRKTDARHALLRRGVESLVIHGAIRTTSAKARAIRSLAEHLITVAKTGTLTAERRIRKELTDEKAVRSMMRNVGPKYRERMGGYTRTIHLPSRVNDGADMVRIELV